MRFKTCLCRGGRGEVSEPLNLGLALPHLRAVGEDLVAAGGAQPVLFDVRFDPSTVKIELSATSVGHQQTFLETIVNFLLSIVPDHQDEGNSRAPPGDRA